MYLDQLLQAARKVHAVYSDQLLGAAHQNTLSIIVIVNVFRYGITWWSTSRNIFRRSFETLLVTFASLHFEYLLELDNIQKVQTLNKLN